MTTGDAAPPVQPACSYTLAPGVLLKAWDDGPGVAYDAQAAMTHLLSADAMTALLASAARPGGCALTDLAQAVLDAEQQAHGEMLAHLGDIVDRLVQAGLLRRAA